jgi:RimJ/RimL family protein N-acetyltransferase
MGAGNRMTVTTDSGQLIGMRPYRLDDAEHMVDGMQSYSVVRTLGRVFAPSLEAERTWIAERAADPTGFGWAITIDDRPIGSIGVEGIENRRGTAGAVIYDQTQWSAGIASAAARASLYFAVTAHDMLAVDAGVYACNPASYRLQLGVGFVLVGRVHQGGIVDGKPSDMLQLMWVNPDRARWNYFWRNAEPNPHGIEEPFSAGRKRALKSLAWARKNVQIL